VLDAQVVPALVEVKMLLPPKVLMVVAAASLLPSADETTETHGWPGGELVAFIQLAPELVET
jgi:hypothetical protein